MKPTIVYKTFPNGLAKLGIILVDIIECCVIPINLDGPHNCTSNEGINVRKTFVTSRWFLSKYALFDVKHLLPYFILLRVVEFM
jgi:hypothetical protein